MNINDLDSAPSPNEAPIVVSHTHWQSALDQAWRSFGEGNMGVGAILLAQDGSKLVGRNRTLQPQADQFSGSPIAHAEIDVLRNARQRSARTGTLLSTLQPCMMCSGAAIMAGVGYVRYLAKDPAWPEQGLLSDSRIQWPMNGIKFDYCQSAWSGLGILLPLIGFVERLNPVELEVYDTALPSHMALARKHSNSKVVRKLAQNEEFDIEIAMSLLDGADASELDSN